MCAACYRAWYFENHPEKWGLLPDRPRRRKRGTFDRSDPESLSAYQQLWRYNLTDEQYAVMLDLQGDACAICRRPFAGLDRSPDVDHDHRCCAGNWSCGTCVRGLLCRSCNNMISKAGDSPGVLRAGAAYLEGRE